jgi:hypothetical protein
MQERYRTNRKQLRAGKENLQKNKEKLIIVPLQRWLLNEILRHIGSREHKYIKKIVMYQLMKIV